MKKAIIVGCNGQDGFLLYEFLLKKKYKIIGIARNSIRSTESSWSSPVNIDKTKEVFDLIRTVVPDEIYYLAAIHHSSEDVLSDKNIELFNESYNVHVLSLINFLEGMRRFAKKTKLFYAASSIIFGDATIEPQDESTPLNPKCIYGITKSSGLLVCRFYRNSYDMFVSSGILYNHESKYRKPNFVSKKILQGAINIKNKKQDKLILGDLNAKIDWGYAPDYVVAFYKILNSEAAEEFVVATGVKHSVLDFVKITFKYLDLDWRNYIEEDKHLITRKRKALVGNPKKLMTITGWRPTVDFRQMIKLLLIGNGITIND